MGSVLALYHLCNGEWGQFSHCIISATDVGYPPADVSAFALPRLSLSFDAGVSKCTAPSHATTCQSKVATL